MKRLVERFQMNKTKGVLNMKIERPLSAIISTKKVLKYAKKYNTKAHILHISTADEMELLQNKGKFNCLGYSTFNTFLSKLTTS